MPFNTEFQTFAFPTSAIDLIPSLIETYGDTANDNQLVINTICCGWDNVEQTKLRALRFPETVSLYTLTDRRNAYTALWSTALLSAFSTGEFSFVQELTQDELVTLLPAPSAYMPSLSGI